MTSLFASMPKEPSKGIVHDWPSVYPYSFGTILRQAGTLDNRAMVICRAAYSRHVDVLFLGILTAVGSIPERAIYNGEWVVEDT